jgi:hypothetical protein
MTYRPYPTPTSGRIRVPASKVPQENRIKPKVELAERTKIQIDRENYEKRLSNAHAIKELSEKTLGFHKKLYALEERYKNGEPTALPDFDAAVQKLVQGTANSFIFAENRAAFERNAPSLILPRRLSVRTGNARGLHAEYRQHLGELLDFQTERALKADTDYDLESAEQEVEDALARGVEGGLHTLAEANSLREGFRARSVRSTNADITPTERTQAAEVLPGGLQEASTPLQRDAQTGYSNSLSEDELRHTSGGTRSIESSPGTSAETIDEGRVDGQVQPNTLLAANDSAGPGLADKDDGQLDTTTHDWRLKRPAPKRPSPGHQIAGDPAPLALDELKMVPRHEWALLPPEPKDLDRRDRAFNVITLHHTGDKRTPQEVEVLHREMNPFDVAGRWVGSQVGAAQRYPDYGDVAYHFMIGEDGTIYEGRSLDAQSADVKGHNLGNIGIAFLGDYSEQPLTQAQLDAARALITALRNDYFKEKPLPIRTHGEVESEKHDELMGAKSQIDEIKKIFGAP